MILCIAALGFLGWWVLGLAPASAILLGAVMAPTDPVLAADVQVGPPSKEKEDHVRFSLTSEAGMNDGMAFPFTWMAIAVALASQTGEEWLWSWFWQDLLYKIIAGVGAGYLLGRLLSFLVFTLPKKTSFPKIRDGFVAVAATLMVYGLTEIIHGYGFIAVFVAGLTIGSHEKPHKYHRELHDFTEQIERIFLVVLLLMFGGSLAQGLLRSLTTEGILIGLAFIFIIRPAASYLTLIGQKITQREKIAISFFGIRGIGSFYYLAFGLTHAHFAEAEELWAISGFVVLVSVIVHGVLASPVMRYLDLRRSPVDLEV
jgi:NhaP-type Na+/H+ or K+/H+ antiporter